MRVRHLSTLATFDLAASGELGIGGEARVLTVPRHPHLVAKVYHEPTAEQGDKLRAMINHPLHATFLRAASAGDYRHVAVAWPLDLLVDPQGPMTADSAIVIGFVMPRIANARHLADFYNPAARRQYAPQFHYKYLHRTARNLAAAIRDLHAHEVVVGDLNESNVMVSPAALVTLVDADSMQIREPHTNRLWRCRVGRPEYTPPELLGQSLQAFDREPAHDAFALAVLIFQILMEGAHPFAGRYLRAGEPPSIAARIAAGHFPHAPTCKIYEPMSGALPLSILHPALQELFLRCFVEGHANPETRPSAKAWVDALDIAEADLQACAVNDNHRFRSHMPACPWCERTVKLNGRDPFPQSAPITDGPSWPARMAGWAASAGGPRRPASPDSSQVPAAPATGWPRRNSTPTGLRPADEIVDFAAGLASLAMTVGWAFSPTALWLTAALVFGFAGIWRIFTAFSTRRMTITLGSILGWMGFTLALILLIGCAIAPGVFPPLFPPG